MRSFVRICFIFLVLAALANSEVEEEHGIEEGSTMEAHEDLEEHGVESEDAEQEDAEHEALDEEPEEPEDAEEHEDGAHGESEDPGDVESDDDEYEPLTMEHIHMVVESLDVNIDGNVSLEEIHEFVKDMENHNNRAYVSELVSHLPGHEQGTYTSEELEEWHQEQDGVAEPSLGEAHTVKFQFADRNHDGVLDEDELVYYAHPAHDPQAHMEIEHEFKWLDQDGSGNLTPQEYHNHSEKDAQADVLQAEAQEFKMLDRDGDGFLSASEFRAFSNGTFKQIDDVRSLFEVADLDKDGKITNDEFADAEEVLLNTDDEHYHLFHDWAKHLGIVNKVEEYDESEDPENPDQDDESEDLENPDQDVSENDESGDPEDADDAERPLMLFDIQSILLAMDKDNDGNMSMEEAKVFVVDMDRNSSVDALSLYTEDVPTNEDGQYTEEALMEWDGEGHEESRHEIHRVKFDAADADKDGFLDDEEVLHYIHPVHDQVQTMEAAFQLKHLDSDNSGDLTMQEYYLETELNPDETHEFRSLDQDGNGLINVQEYRALANGSYYQDQDLKSLFDIADLNKDLQITNSELEEAQKELLDPTGHHYDRLHGIAKHLEL